MNDKKIWLWVGVAAAVVVVGIAVWFFAFGNQGTVPDVVGQSAADAVRTIEASGYKLGETTEATDTAEPPGTIVAEDPPAGSAAKKGTSINVTVAKPAQLVAVPSVSGMEASAAANAVTAAGLVPAPYKDYNAAPAGTVFGQVPSAGQKVSPGTAVALGVSLGTAPVSPTVPDVVGKSKDAATSALKNASFATKVYEAYNSSVAAGLVISQFPGAGEQALAGSTVAVEVSKGKAPSQPSNVTVPNVVGKSESDASSALKSARLGVETYHVYSDTMAKGMVSGQVPAAGEKVAKGTVIGIAISDGKAPQSVTVPNVVGQTEDEATTALEALGLKPLIVADGKSEAAQGTVLEQLPTADSKVPPGTQVVLKVAKPAAMPY